LRTGVGGETLRGDGTDPFGIDVIFLGLGPQPADRTLHVFQLRGEGIERLVILIGMRQAIIDRDGSTRGAGLPRWLSIRPRLSF
jgi:hypothetical protein